MLLWRKFRSPLIFWKKIELAEFLNTWCMNSLLIKKENYQTTRLYSSSTCLWPMAPNFCSQLTKS